MSRKNVKPVEVIPFRLNNIEDFLPDSSYPDYHPKSVQYERYWTERTEECIYGLWGNDSVVKGHKKIGGFRWLPGPMVFHVHHCPIMKEIPGQKSKSLTNPDLRDAEWFIGYDLAACDGFSGMSHDKDITCFRPVGKLERNEHVTHAEKILIDRYGDLLRDKNGKFKKYVDAREYMYQTHDDIMGDPLWLNESQNYMLLSSRRLGKSYIVINGVAVYQFVFNGARTLEEYFDQATNTTTVVGSGESSKTKEFLQKWHVTYDWLRVMVGGHGNDSGVWWKKLSGSVAKENNFLTDLVKLEGGDGLTGPGNRLWHVSFKQSASKGAGTSMDEGIIEECGLTENIADILAENEPAQRGDYKFGKSTIIGTGGDFKIIEASKLIFFRPKAYGILPCKNLFDPGGEDTARFVPATYFQNQYRDEQGNLDVQKAFEDTMHVRKEKEALDTVQYLRHKASFPLNHHEVFTKVDGNAFPVSNLEDRREALRNGAIPVSKGKIAFYDRLREDAYWIEDLNGEPLWELQDLMEDSMNKEGCIVQYESPRDYRPKRVSNDPNPMYVLFLEPVRNDVGTSFVYAYVWKFDDFKDPSAMTHNVVCEWFGRFDNNNDKNLRRVMDIAAYYGCNIFPEINNDAIIGVARRMKRLDWLYHEIENVEGLEVHTKAKHRYGFYVAPMMRAGLLKLTNELLRTQVNRHERIEGDEILIEETILADVLNSRMACDQLVNYNDETGNYDAVDGLRLLAVWYKSHEKVESQFEDPEADKRLRDLLNHLKRQRVASKRVNAVRSYELATR